MKSVLFLIDGLGIGGSESHLVSLLNIFDFNRYKVDLLLCRRNGILEQYIPNEVSILQTPGFFQKPRKNDVPKLLFLYSRFRFGTGRRINTLKRNPLHDAQIFWKYYNKCFKELPCKYDFAVAFGQGFPCYYVADKIEAEIKLLSINNDLKADGYQAKFDNYYFSKYDFILPVTEALKLLLLKSYSTFSDRMFVYENTFNPEFMKKLSESEKAFYDNFDGKKIVSVGRLVPQKGWDLAINAAKILKDHRVKFKWYIIGHGFLQSKLEELINSLNLQEDVILTGMQLNPFKYLKECDLYVQTSRYEGFCRTIKEAKVFGLPIVTTNFNVVHEQITNGLNGLIVEMDENAIARGIEELISNPGLRHLFAENIRKEPEITRQNEFSKFEKYLIPECSR